MQCKIKQCPDYEEATSNDNIIPLSHVWNTFIQNSISVYKRTPESSMEGTKYKNGCMEAFRSIRRSKKTSVVVLFIAFMVDMMLLTAVEPVLPNLLKDIDDDPDLR